MNASVLSLIIAFNPESLCAGELENFSNLKTEGKGCLLWSIKVQ